jgi:glycosyltransferase involved in cell wall biosynthesis
MSETRPLVSFIIAAYNEENFIVECIDSCLSQTFPNIEICVTDDGSTDKTWEIMVNQYQNDSRVKLDKFDMNKGKIYAFNNSYKQSTGEYIAIVGADDVSFEDRIASSYNLLRKENCDLVFGKVLYCDENLVPINYGQRKLSQKKVTLEQIIFSNIFYGATLFFNRKIAEKIFPIPHTLLFEDWWIGFVSVLYGKAIFLNKYLIKYRQHEKNDNSLLDEEDVVIRLKNDFKRHPEYYKCFFNEIKNNDNLLKKERYLKLINLNAAYRKIFMEDNAYQRIKFLPEVLKNAEFCMPFFVAIALAVFGNKIYKIKKHKLFKYFFHYSTGA